MSVETDLTAEIGKWSERLDESLLNAKSLDEVGARMIRNIKAYRNDSKHFLKHGDLIKSFECLIWAWSLLEIGKELGHLK